MPTARELLEQADALMRRNRERAGHAGIPELAGDIPEIVAEIPELPAKSELAARPESIAEIPELTDVVTIGAPPAHPTTLGDVPELVDAVEENEIEVPSIAELPDERKPSADAGSTTVAPTDETFTAVSTVGSLWRDVPVTEAPTAPPIEGAVPAPAPLPEDAAEPLAPAKPALADDWARWEALAEEIRMQVLQRIDIFTDTRLREQLSVQLQPIVDRASAELVTTINEQVGKLIRAYIAEAIEREIETWRKGNS